MRQLCQVLRVAPAAYYAWQRRRPRLVVEPAWQVAVREAFTDHSQRYGTRRLRAEVQAQGHAVGRWRIRRVLKSHGLRAQQPRCFVPRTTDSDPAVRAAPNRLLGQPAPLPPTECRWVTSRTCPGRAGAGSTWPSGWTAARARLWAGTCATPCRKTWSARPYAAP
ncbi:IS3 family transposase [Hymenobacter volaticus]|uniref:IS3 family transposase n=1 Tax=Hymenobacter volaticus TaxID=2932254 RepID=A0ABY4G0M9_9BACT|nr:IS3 family transposase [Hymenobacter volaticus]